MIIFFETCEMIHIKNLITFIDEFGKLLHTTIWLWIQVWNMKKLQKIFGRKIKRLLNSFWWGFVVEKLNSALQEWDKKEKKKEIEISI